MLATNLLPVSYNGIGCFFELIPIGSSRNIIFAMSGWQLDLHK